MKLPILSQDERARDVISHGLTVDTTVESAPGVANAHLFEEGGQAFLFLTDRSRLFQISSVDASELRSAIDNRDQNRVSHWLAQHGVEEKEPLETLDAVSVLSASLAVAQKCNLGCSYCYAQEGEFGGTPKGMPLEVAKQTVDALFTNAQSGQTVRIAFMGGEPLLNRSVVIDTTLYASEQSRKKGVDVGFAITTNGTLLTPKDGEFFEHYGFAVTISLDGIGDQHDQLRPYKGGRGTYNDVIRHAGPLLKMQRRMQVGARVTVTPSNCDLPSILDALVNTGFHSVGFSPMLRSPSGRSEMTASDLSKMLTQMVACGNRFESELLKGRRYPFSNLVTALKELHRGTHRPYPCGAGAGYVGVSATGDWYACHRFVEESSAYMGASHTGIDMAKQQRWLANRHVDRQQPCKQCWARYLCGGGCHHEVMSRGRHACDFIRGWLDYCLRSYVRLRRLRPGYFDHNLSKNPLGSELT